jgi:pSer/pThr/pTyr-binding forkhead associated (FHA) protein
LAQVILKEGWLRVEAGFRVGREILLTKEEVLIGRAEVCDIGLFGDSSIERTHARILRQNNRYILVDEGSTAGTFINDWRVTQPTPLKSGDAIRLGSNILRFGERQRKELKPLAR